MIAKERIDVKNLQGVWKPIDGWDYLISEKGEVYSNKRQRLLKVWKADNKYPRITLTKGIASKVYTIHRLVAIAFIPNPDGKQTVNHKDGNKHNCHVSNLEWATWRENSIHAHETGLQVHHFKESEDCPNARLNNVDVAMIRLLVENGFTCVQVAKRFGVHSAHISHIKRRKSWKLTTTELTTQTIR